MSTGELHERLYAPFTLVALADHLAVDPVREAGDQRPRRVGEQLAELLG
jgi:hypothetical protein